MIKVIWLKVFCALLLAACLGLPFTSCSKHYDSQGHLIWQKEGEPLPSDAVEVVEYQYPLEGVHIAEPGSLVIPLAFLWPLAVVGYGAAGKRWWLKRALWWLEPLLLLGSATTFYLLLAFGRPAAGFFVAAGCVVLYAAAWVTEAAQGWRKRRVRAA